MSKKKDDIQQIEDRIIAATRGEFTERFVLQDQNSEFAGIKHSLNDLFDRIEVILREVTAIQVAAKEKRFHRIVQTKGLDGMLLSVAEQSTTVLQSVEVQEAALQKQKEEQVKYSQELASNFESTITQKTDMFQNGVQNVADISASLNQKSHDMIQQIHSGKEKSEETSFRVQSVATATEELSASIAEISRQTEFASMKSKSSMEILTQTMNMVEGITVAAEDVSEIINIINDVARQTNLLALNAAIEAARAGEVGKGFGVVAGEVKELARQTRSATQNISQKINNMLSATDSGKTSIQEVSHSIKEMNEMVNVIATAIDEQSSVTRSIAKNAVEASQATEILDANLTSMSDYTSDVEKQLQGMVSEVLTLKQETETLRDTSREFINQILVD